MTNVQNVFDKVIADRYYSERNGSVLMCEAIKNASQDGVINAEEFHLARKEIREYLGGFGSLGGLLSNKEQPWHFTARLAIYENWVNKPKFKQ